MCYAYSWDVGPLNEWLVRYLLHWFIKSMGLTIGFSFGYLLSSFFLLSMLRLFFWTLMEDEEEREENSWR